MAYIRRCVRCVAQTLRSRAPARSGSNSGNGGTSGASDSDAGGEGEGGGRGQIQEEVFQDECALDPGMVSLYHQHNINSLCCT